MADKKDGKKDGMTAAERRPMIQACANEIKGLQEQIDEIRPIPDLVHTLSRTNGDVPAKPYKMCSKKLLLGHFGKIYAMDWGKEDTQLISAAQDGSLIIWNALTGNKLDVITLRSTWVMSVAMSNSGLMTASGGLDNMVTIYKLKADGSSSGGELKQHKELAEHGGYISGAVFLDDSKVISSSGDQRCILWDVDTGKIINQFKEHAGDVMDVDLLPGHASHGLAVTGSVDNVCKVWDYRVDSKTKAMTFYGHNSDINTVSAMHNGHSFVSGSDDSGAIMHDTRSYGPLQEFRGDKILGGVSSVAMSSSGRYLFAGYDDMYARVWDTLTGRRHQDLGIGSQASHTSRVSCLGVNSEGTALATGSWDQQLRVWA
jgi:guanine nucleotide-binding protein G(I)/G(S)/G(T) subunit beta-1